MPLLDQIRENRFVKRWLPLLIYWSVITFALWSAAALIIYLYGQPDHAAPSDVIVILGAGVFPDGTPTDAHIRRIRHAVALYKRGLAPLLLCTGGYNTPLHVKTEAQVCTEILLNSGVPQSAILNEEQSHTTEENAIEARKVMQAHHLKTALIVTDNFHILRSKILFTVERISATVSPAQATQGPLSLQWVVFGSYREVPAFLWYTLKHIL